MAELKVEIDPAEAGFDATRLERLDSHFARYVDEKMTLKSNYYSRANLDRLAKLSGATSRTEASLLREALDDLFEKYRDAM